MNPASEAPFSAAAAAHVTPAEDRVPVGQKIGYGLGIWIDQWGHWHFPNFAGLVFNIFLGLSPFYVGIAIIANRVFDAVSDPLFGWLSDNTRTRWGRRRPYMFVGAVLAGLGFPILVWVSPGWGSVSFFGHPVPVYFWYMLGSSAIYLPLVSCFNMPYQSLGYEMTPDYHERTVVFSYQTIIKMLPATGLFFGGFFLSMRVWVGATPANVLEKVRFLLTHMSAWGAAGTDEHPNLLLGAKVFCVACGIIMVAIGLLSASLVRERYYGKVVAGRQTKISIRETLWQTLQCRPFRITVIMNLAYSLGLSMVGTLGYYDTLYYVCQGNVSVGSRWNFGMGLAGMVLGAAGVPVFAIIAKHMGKRHSMTGVFLSAIAIFIGCWWFYNPKAPVLQLFASGLIAFIGAGFFTVWNSMVADVVDYDELENGRRREGSFAACNSWIMKVGMALGAGASFFILGWVGFDSKLGSHQAPHTLLMIRLLFSAIPIVGLALALVALTRFSLSRERMAEIRALLERRRGTV